MRDGARVLRRLRLPAAGEAAGRYAARRCPARASSAARHARGKKLSVTCMIVQK